MTIPRTWLLALWLPVASMTAQAASLEDVVSDVVDRHMAEKHIPGLSVAIVQQGEVLFTQGYGRASIEFDLPATPDTVYPISSVSKIFAGLLAGRLMEAGRLDLDTSIADVFDDVPADKRAVTIRHLLQHTHGLQDFYRSDDYRLETGRTVDDSSADELIAWSLQRPLESEPGEAWAYSLAGYVVLARALELLEGRTYSDLVQAHVLQPLGMRGWFGGSEVVVPGRHPLLYEWMDDAVAGHFVDFPEFVWAAGGLNLSVSEFSKLLVALSTDDFIGRETKRMLWDAPVLANGQAANYGLGWFSYVTSRGRHVVGHEGGGASWVIYYPDLDLAVIALSNMSGARADSLPYEIAREALAQGLLQESRAGTDGS